MLVDYEYLLMKQRSELLAEEARLARAVQRKRRVPRPPQALRAKSARAVAIAFGRARRGQYLGR
jgi:hypothetical protein